MGELKGTRAGDEERRKMVEILQRAHQQQLEDEEEEREEEHGGQSDGEGFATPAECMHDAHGGDSQGAAGAHPQAAHGTHEGAGSMVQHAGDRGTEEEQDDEDDADSSLLSEATLERILRKVQTLKRNHTLN